MLSFGGLGIGNQCAKQPRGAPWSRPRDPCLETRESTSSSPFLDFFVRVFRIKTYVPVRKARRPHIVLLAGERWPSPERLTARFYISKFILSSVGSRGYPTQLIPRAGIRDGARPETRRGEERTKSATWEL